ncbi:MAG: methyltransferase domain-containing protein [Dokdonella sp.]
MSSLSEITEQLLRCARIEQGMHVLDIGCGSGELTRAIADLVGLSGNVVGLDGSAVALSAAEAATDTTKYTNIVYVHCDLQSLPHQLGVFDVVVGRRVLMYVAKPEGVIAALISKLKPGGRIALQEHDTTMTPGRTGCWPIHDQVHAWLWDSVSREGANPRFGFSLAPMLADAGADVQAVWAQAIFSGYETGVHHSLHDLTKMMLPRLLATGVATEVEVDLPTLEARLAAERKANKSTYVTDMAVCVVAQRTELGGA